MSNLCLSSLPRPPPFPRPFSIFHLGYFVVAFRFEMTTTKRKNVTLPHLTLTSPNIAVVCFAVVFSAIFVPAVMSAPADYVAKRNALIHSEQALRTGGSDHSLNPKERIVNDILMQEKRRLIESARLNSSDFVARQNFLNATARAAMEATKAFQIIKKMPKGNSFKFKGG